MSGRGSLGRFGRGLRFRRRRTFFPSCRRAPSAVAGPSVGLSPSIGPDWSRSDLVVSCSIITVGSTAAG